MSRNRPYHNSTLQRLSEREKDLIIGQNYIYQKTANSIVFKAASAFGIQRHSAYTLKIPKVLLKGFVFERFCNISKNRSTEPDIQERDYDNHNTLYIINLNHSGGTFFNENEDLIVFRREAY